MENTTRISCSAVTHIGTGRAVNEDRIYANGKFLNTFQCENSNISLEITGSQFIFALSDGMDAEKDAGSRISIHDDLRKFQKKAAASTKDIRVKLDEMAEYVQQSSNLLYSMSLGEEIEKNWDVSFAGLIIENENLGAVCLGKCKIFKLEADNLKLLMDDYRKTERLLKMGIISNEQAELISGQYKNSGNDRNMKVKKSDIFKLKEDSVYLLCSNGLVDAVSEDTIYEILAENDDTDKAAGLLVSEAVENGGEDNITAMVIRIDRTSFESAAERASVNIPSRRLTVASGRYARNPRKRTLDTAKLVQTCLILLVSAAVLFGAFKLWDLFRNPDGKDVSAQQQESTGKSNLKSTVPTDNANEETDESSIAMTPSPDATTAVSETSIVIDENTTYTVKAGDSLYKISEMYYGDEKKYQLIIDANDIKDPGKIQVGQVLKIPPLE